MEAINENILLRLLTILSQSQMVALFFSYLLTAAQQISNNSHPLQLPAIHLLTNHRTETKKQSSRNFRELCFLTP